MDDELKEYLETKEYYEYIQHSEITDAQAERIRDTFDFQMWRLKQALKELGHEILKVFGLK